MGIQINGNNDIISALDGSWTAEGASINTSGILTATTFKGNIVGTAATFTGPVTIGGTLTYEDVTNIDSVGIITANAGIHLDDVLSHKGNTNTKIRFPANDTVTVETAGTERLRITSDGKYYFPGTGGGSGSRGLEIDTEAVGAQDEGVILNARASGTTGRIKFQTNSATAMTILGNGGNIGIGTDNPNKILTVRGSSTPEILIKPTDATPAIYVGDSNRTGAGQHLAEYRGNWNGTTVARIVVAAGDDTSNKDDGVLSFWTASAGSVVERLKINTDGHITLACANNVRGLQLNPGSGAGSLVFDRNGYITSFIRASDGGSNVGGGSGGGSRIRLGKQQIHFDTFPYVTNVGDAPTYTERLTINAVGDVTLGYAGNSLYFQNGFNNSASRIQNGGASNSSNLRFYTRNSGTESEKLRITSAGNVGINDSSPSSQLVVKATTDDNPALQLYRQSTGGDIASIIWKTGSGDQAKINYRGAAGASEGLQFYTAGGGSSQMRMIIDHSGNIGVGNNDPAHKLHVFDGSATNSAVLFDSSINSSTLSGNTANNGYGHALCLENSQGTTGNIVSLGFQVRTSSAWSNAAITVKAMDTSGNAQMSFWTESGNSIGEKLRIKSSGEVHMGASSPTTSDAGADDLVIGNTSGGVNRGMTIWSNSSQNGSIAFADNNANFRGAIQYIHADDDLRFLAVGEEKFRITEHGTYNTPITGGDSVNTKSAGRFYTISGATPLDGTNTNQTETPLMRCGHSFNGTMRIWMAFNGSEFHNGCRQYTFDCQGTYGYVDIEEESFFHTNALGAGLNSLVFQYQNAGSPNYYFKVKGTWASGQNTPYILWSWTGHNSEYPYAL